MSESKSFSVTINSKLGECTIPIVASSWHTAAQRAVRKFMRTTGKRRQFREIQLTLKKEDS